MAEATESIEESENSLESLISAYLPSMFGIKPSSKPLKSFELDDIKITESLSILESLEAMEINSDGYYQCPQCLFKSKHCKATVRTHINTVHMGFRRFVCDYCGLGKILRDFKFYTFY